MRVMLFCRHRMIVALFRWLNTTTRARWSGLLKTLDGRYGWVSLSFAVRVLRYPDTRTDDVPSTTAV